MKTTRKDKIVICVFFMFSCLLSLNCTSSYRVLPRDLIGKYEGTYTAIDTCCASYTISMRITDIDSIRMGYGFNGRQLSVVPNPDSTLNFTSGVIEGFFVAKKDTIGLRCRVHSHTGYYGKGKVVIIQEGDKVRTTFIELSVDSGRYFKKGTIEFKKLSTDY